MRSASRFERRLIGCLWATALLASALPSLFDRRPNDCKTCPDNPVLLANRPGAAKAIEGAFTVIGVAIFVGVIVLLVRRWRRATAAQRRILGPVYLSGGVTLALVGVLFGVGFASNTAAGFVAVATFTTFGTVPLFFLAGLLRTRLYRAGARLLREVPDNPTPEEIQTGFRDVLGDKSNIVTASQTMIHY